MRINRDVRFSADKSPYKTQIAMMFVPEGRSRMGTPGFGVQITTEKVELVAGQFAFDPVQLEAYRRAVLDGAAGPALEAAAVQVSEAGDYPVEGRQLKRVPRGFDADHSRAEWLLYKGLHVFAPAISLEVAASPELVDNRKSDLRAQPQNGRLGARSRRTRQRSRLAVRCRRIRLSSSGSSMTAITFISAPHVGHTIGSTS